jgi:hypothetical protein
MALNASGPISLGGSTTGQSINLELGQGATDTVSLNDASVRTLAGVSSGEITMPTNFYGKSSMPQGNLIIEKKSYPASTTSATFNINPTLGGGSVSFTGSAVYNNDPTWGPQQLFNDTISIYDWAAEGGPPCFAQFVFAANATVSTIFIIPRSQGDNFPPSVTVSVNSTTINTYYPTTLTLSSGQQINYTGIGYKIQPGLSGTTWLLSFNSPLAYIGEIEFWGSYTPPPPPPNSIIVNGNVYSFGIGSNWDFPSYGTTYTISFSSTCTVQMWVWGGAGGNTSRTSGRTGGGGGYSKCTWTFAAGVTYVVQVASGGYGGQTGTVYQVVPGGFPGGGTGYNPGSVFDGASGGGYSGVFIFSALQNNAICIAAGGGGASGDTAYGGNGGGLNGANSSNVGSRGGAAGNQSSGGAGGSDGGQNGSALQGGNGQSGGGAGGGGGYYGGGGGAQTGPGGGGGGSGYIHPSAIGGTTQQGSFQGTAADPDFNKPLGVGDASVNANGNGGGGYILFYRIS